MITFTEHDTATCPDCDEPLYYGVKEEASGWKIQYECGDHCGWERMAGWIKLNDVDYRDEIYERAETIGKRWD